MLRFQKILGLIVLLWAVAITAQATSVGALRTEYLNNPVGVSFQHPRFSWKLYSERSAIVQTAYQIIVEADGMEVWNSGKVSSSQSHLVPYEGPFLKGRTRYDWKVMVWDNYKFQSAYSEQAFFETGILDTSNWKAEWIKTALSEEPREKNPVQYFRREIALNEGIKKARLYITSDGLYRAFINGEKVGDQEFTPGWTSYAKRLQYQTYDVSEAFIKGRNCLAVMLAEGWHRGRINYRGKDKPFKNELRLLLQLEVEFENGEKKRYGSDASWKASHGGLLESSIYDGEVFDARKEPKNWMQPGFRDRKWLNCLALNLGKERLIGSHSPPVKVQERLDAETLKSSNTDKTHLFDFGQNLTGRVAIELKVDRSTELLLEHGEALDSNGNLYTENLRDAQARVLLKFNKAGTYSYSPHFSFMGFRYLKVTGVERSQIVDLKAEVLHSDLETTGAFTCSHPDINQLYQNIIWSQKGNFLDVPTDCPQRDERLGWTGDVQVFATTAGYNMQVAPFFTKWLADLAADQTEDGAVPWVVPNAFAQKKPPASGWADAAVIVPWKMYQLYGDLQFLERQYASMKAWVDYMAEDAEEGLWKGKRHFGDWLSYKPDKQPQILAAVTENDLLAAIYFQRSTQLLVKTAEVLGKEEDALKYTEVYKTANEAFLQEYVTAKGRLVSGTQTAYALALAFELLPEEMRAQAVQRLVANIEYYGHLTTGFLGVSKLNEVLSAHGHSQLAYDLFFRREHPSWLYAVDRGATTIWERWDAQREDGTFQESYLNSMNHYANGAIGEWMIERIAGIQPNEQAVGFRSFTIAPQVSDSLAFVKASYDCIYGRIYSAWKYTEVGGLQLQVEIPANTKAAVQCPEGYEIVSATLMEEGELVPMNFFQGIGNLSLGSGVYSLDLSPVAQE